MTTQLWKTKQVYNDIKVPSCVVWCIVRKLVFESVCRPCQHLCCSGFCVFFSPCVVSHSLFVALSVSLLKSFWLHASCRLGGFTGSMPPPSRASSLITLGYWSSQGHGTLELKLGLHQLMTDYSTVGPWEQAGSTGTEGLLEHQACSALQWLSHFSSAPLIAKWT